ncbi:DUF1852 family protein [Novosphingobium profundi]|nr:DUF1852 family protein [Novosphingobium profundi]
MDEALEFRIKTIPFDEDYRPAQATRLTTNFANLARGAKRRENLRKTLKMIDNRFNALAHWDNPEAARYALATRIVSVEIAGLPIFEGKALPIMELLSTQIRDTASGTCLEGITGNSFSSYVRDYDFSILLPRLAASGTGREGSEDFGALHGTLFQRFVQSRSYTEAFAKPPVICLSASTSQTYRRTGNRHPVLGVEYRQDELSRTDRYFAKMGLGARFFMPEGSVAPLAFYVRGDLASDYTPLELIGAIATMETFQKIYRPEIYNANAAAGACFRPSLSHTDYSSTRIDYDREERSHLGLAQGRFAEEHFIKPFQALLEQRPGPCAP